MTNIKLPINTNSIDLYTNIELERNVEFINPIVLKNTFDLDNQYNLERNNSLKFCIYGSVECKNSDADGLIFEISTNNQDFLYSPKITSGATKSNLFQILTLPLNENKSIYKNIYNQTKAYYYFNFELDINDLNSYMQNLASINQTPVNKNIIINITDYTKELKDSFTIPFILFDNLGNRVPFGTISSDVDDDGNITDITNDFPFFYDRHWIKNNFFISKVAYLYFLDQQFTDLASVNNTIIIDIGLNIPSKNGFEQATFVLLQDGIPVPTTIASLSSNIINWNVGDQNKQLIINIFDSSIISSNNNISIEITDYKNVNIKTSTFNFSNKNIASAVVNYGVIFNKSVNLTTFAQGLSIANPPKNIVD